MAAIPPVPAATALAPENVRSLRRSMRAMAFLPRSLMDFILILFFKSTGEGAQAAGLLINPELRRGSGNPRACRPEPFLRGWRALARRCARPLQGRNEGCEVPATTDAQTPPLCWESPASFAPKITNFRFRNSHHAAQ